LSFCVSVVLIAGIAIPTSQGITMTQFSIKQIAAWTIDGWIYVMGQRITRYLVTLFFIAAVCTGLWAPLAPLFIRECLGGSEQVLGWQLGLFGAGAIIGGLLAPRMISWVGNGPMLSAAMICEASVMIIYSLVSEVNISGLFILIWGVIVSLIIVPFYSLLQISVTDTFLGRTMTIVKQVESIATVIAMFSAMLTVTFCDTHSILLYGGIIYLVAMIAATVSKDRKHLLVTHWCRPMTGDCERCINAATAPDKSRITQ
jgi:predicted MFS family arabinose efflux permease